MKFPVLVNIVMFQLGWWLCVVAGETLLIYSVIAWILFQPWLLRLNQSGDRLGITHQVLMEYALLVAAVCVGVVVEMGLFYLGVWRYPEAFALPLWLLTLWALLAGTICHSLRWLVGRYALSALLAALLAPLSYFSGAALNDNFSMRNGMLPIVSIATVWAVTFPLLLWFAKCLSIRDRRLLG